MKYLKKYNEELNSDTYKSAADKLSQMGHVKRPEELMKSYDVAKKREEREEIARKKREEIERIRQEEERKKREELEKIRVLEECSKLGNYKLTLNYFDSGIKKFIGDFYISFSWDEDNFQQTYLDWKNGHLNNLWLSFNFAILPASKESKEIISFLNQENKQGKSYIGNFIINLSEFRSEDEKGNKLKLNPNGSFTWEYWDEVSSFYFSDRDSAQKFKKLLYDIFKGDIVIDETSEIPGGLKELVLDHLCSDMDHTLEEYEDFMESLKKIRVNKLYRD